MNNKGIGTIFILGLLLFATCTVAFKVDLASAASQKTVLLGDAVTFSVLAGQGITNTGATTITGDVGTYPNPSETGFPGLVTLHGTNHYGDHVTQDAKIDLKTAYNDAAGRTPFSTVPPDLGGTNLTAGVYRSTSGAFLITGTLTLDAEGDPNAVFIFQAASSLTTATGSVVKLINGATDCNVFWQVTSSATIQVNSMFVGTILALTSIFVYTNATVDGRVLARNGEVTLQNNTIGIGQAAVGEGIILAPASSTNPPGASHTVTATVAGSCLPLVGRSVNFTVVSGPNAGLNSSVSTGSNGQASFTYTSSLNGTDTIEARFVNDTGATVISNLVTKNWTGEYVPPKPGGGMVGGEDLPIDTLSVLLALASQYSAVIVLVIMLLVLLGFLLVKKRNKAHTDNSKRLVPK
jgi:hypothetical protein